MVVNKLKTKLMDVGFTEYEAKVYIALLTVSPSTAYEVAKRAAVPTSKVYEVLAKLSERGAVSEFDDSDKRKFIPLAPDDLVATYRSRISTTLDELRSELNSVASDVDLSFLRTIRDYGYLLDKAKRIIEEASDTLLLSIWPQEMGLLRPALCDAANRNVRIAIIHFGPILKPLGCTYVHPIQDTISEEKGGKSLVIVSDSNEVLFAKVTKNGTAEGVHSTSDGFVAMAEDFIKHDIYMMKIVRRFETLLHDTFGENYSRLRNVFQDDEV